MNVGAPLGYTADADGVGWIIFDDPAARANVFTPEMQKALADAITAVERDKVRALVLASGKETIFIAGADLKLIEALPNAAAAEEFSRTGQRLFQRIADSRVPVVCAIHGACAGGGFELALACDWRIASDASSTQIGLPETSLGTIPGWGGCVRLPRLIGAQAALDHVLKGQLVGSRDALNTGLVDELVASAELRVSAKAVALRLVRDGQSIPRRHPPPEAVFFQRARDAVLAKTRGQSPALLAAIDVVEQGTQVPLSDALEVEARKFGEVTAGEVCKNMVHVFFLREAAKKRTLEGWFEGRAGFSPPFSGDQAEATSIERSRERGGLKPAPPPIHRVGVVGAGVMGSGIAQWLAVRGFEVVMRDMQPEFVERGVAVIRTLFDETVRRGKMSSSEARLGLQRIATTTQWDGFESCDLVIEAIVENTASKQALFTELATVVRPDAILASNTSALPIEEIAGHVSNPERTVGIHFFNPVSRMTLVELVLSSRTAAETAGRVLAWVKALGKSPIICRSSPGFLVTRVLFFYLNAAVQLWEQETATREIDDAMREFGWPMGPLRLIDEVGVDVTDFIFGEMEHYFSGRFTRSTATTRMLAAGLKGRKNGASRGFYRYDNGKETVNDAETIPLLTQRAMMSAADSRGAGARRNLTDQLMRVMVDEAERCLAEGVVKSPDEVDFALLSGAGFPAFRGGLLRWARRG